MGIFESIVKSFGKDPQDEKSVGQITDSSDQTPEEIALVSHVREKIDKVRQSSSRITQEGVAFTNTAYLLGYDGVVYDTNLKQFKNIDPKRRLTRNRFKINKILPTVQNRLARLTQSPPTYDVRPNSNSSEDKDASRLGLQIIEDVFDKQVFPEKRQEVHMNAMQGGVGYLQGRWDITLGKPMIDPGAGEFAGYEGDIRIEVLNLFEVFVDPLARNLDDAQWWVKAKVRKLDYFKEQYPERGQAVKEEDVWLMSSLYDLRVQGMVSGNLTAGSQTSTQMKNSAIEMVYYEKRSKNYPNGRMCIAANGILLEDKELPIGEFDLVKIDDILIGGRYNSEAIITHLRPVQDYYNTLRTRMSNWVKMHLGGKYIAARGAGLTQESLDNSDAEVMLFDAVPNAPPPEPMNLPQIPQYAYEEIRVTESDFDQIAGIGEPTRGVAPGSDMPAKGMELLVEQDQTRMSVQTTRNEVAYARLGQIILKYAAKYYEMPRLLKDAGDGLEYAVKEFKGSDLKGNIDAIVIPGSTAPNSKAVNRQNIMNLLQNGLLGNPGDPKLMAKVLKYMEYGDLQEVWKDQALDEQQVKKTLMAIEGNQQPPMHEWDNHQVFIQEMNQYRKTDKYEALSDKQKQMFDFVSEWHVNALVALQNPQIPQQMAMAQHVVNTTEQMKQSGQLGQELIHGMQAQQPTPMPPQGAPGPAPQGPMPMGA